LGRKKKKVTVGKGELNKPNGGRGTLEYLLTCPKKY